MFICTLIYKTGSVYRDQKLNQRKPKEKPISKHSQVTKIQLATKKRVLWIDSNFL